MCNVFQLWNITFVSATLYRMPPQTYVMTPYIDRLTRQLFCKFQKGESAPFKSRFTNRTTSQKLVLSLCKRWICTADLWVHVCVYVCLHSVHHVLFNMAEHKIVFSNLFSSFATKLHRESVQGFKIYLIFNCTHYVIYYFIIC